MLFIKEHDQESIREQPALQEGEGVIKRTRFFRGQSRLPVSWEVWELDPGASEGMHTHGESDKHDGDLEEVYYFLAGDGEMWIESEKVPVTSGDAVMVPSGVDHGFRNVGDVPLKLVLMWAKPLQNPK